MNSLQNRFKRVVNKFVGPVFHLFGFDPRHLTLMSKIPRYIKDRIRFKHYGGIIGASFPVLSDFVSNAGTASGQYFHQDLLVANFIYNAAPVRHIDVGSRIDGFVAHVASFRSIKVLDVRPLPKSPHRNIDFQQFDIVNGEIGFIEKSDSISCLHALEHFGLGRYGDPINPNGHLIGFKNLAEMLEKNGILYLSVPIGHENKVFFNAHRVFHPLEALKWMKSADLELLRFDFVDDDGLLVTNVDLLNSPPYVFFGCGIYTFIKY